MPPTEPALPTGTVTFLFTDIEGSTALWESSPESMRSALERHDGILRAAIAGRGGAVFSTAGDAFAAAFSSADAALGAALDAQVALQGEPWPTEPGLRVRMGLHTGAAHERDGDYFGPTLNRAARVMALAHGGQVLVSMAVEGLVRDGLGEGVSLVDLGAQHLRGLTRSERVFEVRAPGVATGFPPLRGADNGPAGLPTPATSFVGRGEALRDLVALVPSRRLVTLVGPGGVGKTRLSVEVGTALRDGFADGLRFVELAPVRGPDAVMSTVAAALELSVEAGSTTLRTIVDALSGQRLLLVLDNCEHVIDAAAELVGALGRDAPSVVVLATSRERLGVSGEQVWPVPPLDPAMEAVELFLDRARSADPTFDPAAASAQQLVDLCAQLDGIPLAIELAAAHARSSSVDDLCARLADRFRLLRRRRSSHGGDDDRQRTLRGAVEWSYRLLEPDERQLFDRLSVFAGSFDRAAVGAVCSGDGVDDIDVHDLLDALVHRSMVQVDRSGRTLRFRLLETLRQYGEERLAARVDVVNRKDRHLAHYVGVARQASSWYEGAAYRDGAASFEREWDNLRAALAHAEASCDDASADAIVVSTFWYGYNVANEEHERWTRRRLAATPREDPHLLCVAAAWLNLMGDPAAQAELGRRALAAASPDDHGAMAFAWWNVACGAWYGGRRADAWAADVEAKREAALAPIDLAAARILGWPHATAAIAPQDGPALVRDARTRLAPLGNAGAAAIQLVHAGIVAFAIGDFAQAVRDLRDAWALAERIEMRHIEAAALAFLTIRAPAAGVADPGALFRDALGRLQRFRLVSYQHWTLTALADWWAGTGQREEAAQILGYLDRNDAGGNQSVADMRARAAAVVDADPRAAAWRKRGAELTRDGLVNTCIERLGGGDEPPVDVGGAR
jgi:predicted ATPase/class 3 adenylate cyclase